MLPGIADIRLYFPIFVALTDAAVVFVILESARPLGMAFTELTF